MSRTLDSKNQIPRLRWLYRGAGAAALFSGLLMAIAMLSLTASALLPGARLGVLSAFEDLWLIVILKLHAGIITLTPDLLKGPNFLDLSMLALAAIMHVGLYAELRKVSRPWSLVAAIQPILGILVFLATGIAGRSALMGAAFVASILMRRSVALGKVAAYSGILASLLVFAGDVAVGIVPASALNAGLFAAGYLLLTAWLFLIGRRFWSLDPSV